VLLDEALIPVGWLAAHGINLQVIASPAEEIVCGVGSQPRHKRKSARQRRNRKISLKVSV
jgi:hypothetical protein